MEKLQASEKDMLAVVESMLDALHGGFCITDANGVILRLGKSCEDLYGIDNSYVGKNIAVLEEEGIFNPCLSLIAMRERRRVTMTQPDKNGSRLLVTATPIFAPNSGELLYAVSYSSWDIKSVRELQEHYDQLKKETARNKYQLDALKKTLQAADIVCESPKMARVAQLAEKVADADVAVLITGESGSGKCNLAKYIHKLSSRRNQPFGQMNCSAFSGEILEDELFGYVKVKPHTAEEREKPGLCELLSGGTLLLEDIEHMGLETQSKLLHVLKNKEYYKQKGTQAVPADVRLIATTQKDAADLAKYIAPELFYRLSVATLDIPGLKNRREDIPDLARAFLRQYNEKYQKKLRISAAAMELLELYHWPGNITELKCLIHQLVLTIDESLIQSYHLPDTLSPVSASHFTSVMDLRKYLEYYEKRLVLQAYDKCKTTAKLAKYLGISQPSAVRKLQKYLHNESDAQFNNE